MGFWSKLGVGLAGLALLIAGCGGASPAATLATSTESPTQTPAPVYQAYEDLATGDCFDPIVDSDDEILLAAEMRACDEPHLMELFATPMLDAPLGEPYPGVDELGRQGDEACMSAFEDFVGVDYQDSRLDLTFYTPLPDGWEAGDRAIICVIAADGTAPLTQSVEGSEQ